jgi:hypothetical protein
MNTRRGQLYLAHTISSEDAPQIQSDADDYVAEMLPEDAAEYIASLLTSLRAIAAKAQFRLLSDLLSVAEEEARIHSRM